MVSWTVVTRSGDGSFRNGLRAGIRPQELPEARSVSVLSNRASAQRFTMGRLINAITGKKNALVLGKRQDRKVVVPGQPTVTLRSFLAARTSLARLAARVGTVAMRHCYSTPLALGATSTTEATRFGARWCWQARLSRPGYPSGGSRS